MQSTLQTIVLGGGCFWCTEAVFVQVQGILDVESGYCNGHVIRPSYEAVCYGDTGHNEVVKLLYDPLQISTRELLEVFFLVHDPTTLNRQGNDTGSQYRSGIYYTSTDQQLIAQQMLDEIRISGAFPRSVVTELIPLANYWPAEDSHQDFFARNPTQGYCVAVAAPKVKKFRQTFARLQRV